MAFPETYAGLKADLVLTTEEEGSEFVSNLDMIIGKGELKLLRDLDLECFQSEITGTLTIHTRTFARPTGCLMVKALFLTSAGAEILIPRRTYAYCRAFAPLIATEAIPSYYAEKDEGNLYFVDTPDAAYPVIIHGIERPDGLSDTNPTTWLSTNVGDLLLDACLIEAEQYLKAPEEMGTWKASYQEKLVAAQREFRGLSRADYQLNRMASTANNPA